MDIVVSHIYDNLWCFYVINTYSHIHIHTFPLTSICYYVKYHKSRYKLNKWNIQLDVVVEGFSK